MPIVVPSRSNLIRDEEHRPPHLAGLVYGFMFALPLWAIILAVVL